MCLYHVTPKRKGFLMLTKMTNLFVLLYKQTNGLLFIYRDKLTTRAFGTEIRFAHSIPAALGLSLPGAPPPDPWLSNNCCMPLSYSQTQIILINNYFWVYYVFVYRLSNSRVPSCLDVMYRGNS